MSRFTSLSGRRAIIAAGVTGLAIGGTLGAAVAHEVAPVAVMAPVSLTRIAALGTTARSWVGETVVSVRGRVVEVFGDRFVLDDGSGRTLIELGRGASGLVAVGQVVTLQGDLVDGGLHARFLVAADGRVVALRGPGGPRGEEGRRGPPPPPGARDAGRPPAVGPAAEPAAPPVTPPPAAPAR